jgi:hypothetical protein
MELEGVGEEAGGSTEKRRIERSGASKLIFLSSFIAVGNPVSVGIGKREARRKREEVRDKKREER